MPNWCSNTLIVRGEKDKVAEFRKKARGKKTGKGKYDTDLVLNNFYPMPKELENTKSPPTIVPDDKYQEELDKAIKLEKEHAGNEFYMGSRPLSESMSKELIAKHGSNNWYDWKIRHWGTKWDIEAYLQENKPKELIYGFDSAWSPPVAWLDKVAQDFPTLSFTLEFSEGGVGFQGTAEYENGEQISLIEEEYDYSQDEDLEE